MLASGSRRAAAAAFARRGAAALPPRLATLLASRRPCPSSLSLRDAQNPGDIVGSRSVAHAARLAETVPPPPAEDDAAERAPKPFSDLKPLIDRQIYEALVGKPFHFTHMSAVQEAVLDLLPDLAEPCGSSRRSEGSIIEPGADLLVKAKTGTGKTIAFLTPAVEGRLRDIEAERRRFDEQNPDATRAEQRKHMVRYRASSTGILILSPTRELATQIAQEAARLTSGFNDFGVQLFVGGSSKSLQLRSWNRGGRDIVVATPGRMRDVLESVEDIPHNIAKVKTLVLDEADTLLEMGFKDEIDEIVSYLRPKEERQTFLFSATVSKEIRQVANRTMKDRRSFIDCVPEGESNVHEHVPQNFTVLRKAGDQIPHIFRLIAHDQLLHTKGGKAIVFLPTTRETQLFAQLLVKLKRYLPWSYATTVHEIHGGRTQAQRDAAAGSFRASQEGYSILVTSDVSARGVDYPGVTRVIQVGIPTNRDIYIHRVGRTGRAGRQGRGDLVLLPWEARFVRNELKGLPIKQVDVDDTSLELAELARLRDESSDPAPVAIYQALSAATRGFRSSAGPKKREIMTLPVTPRLSEFDSGLETHILPSIDDEMVREAFASKAGYYLAKTDLLDISKQEVVQELKNWAVEGLGLEREPYISPTFLAKLGVKEGKPPTRARKTYFNDVRRVDAGRRRYPSRDLLDGSQSKRNWFDARSEDGDRGHPGRRPRSGGYSDRRPMGRASRYSDARKEEMLR